MIERRTEARIPLRMIIDCFLTDENNFERNIQLWTTNISDSGMGAKWLKWWHCRNCVNCLSWISEVHCKLKECNNSPTIKKIKPGTHIKLKGAFGQNFMLSEKYGKVVWVKNSDDSSYTELGINFIKEN